MSTQQTESVTVRTLLVIPVEVAGRLAVSVAVADHLAEQAASTESVTDTAPDGSAVPHREVPLDRGMRLHVIDAPQGEVTLTYDATVAVAGAATPEQVSDADAFTYVLPSRYCPSDRLSGLASAEFGHIESDAERARRIVSWVHDRLSYTPGSTVATDDALTPLLGGRGVCRDYAHLVVALARAVGMPARYVSVYAPGLSPMDAHAVAEIAVDGQWFLFDATRLAPRRSMVRIGTGRDAADVAILSSPGGVSGPTTFEVTATAAPGLPTGDPEELVTLACRPLSGRCVALPRSLARGSDGLSDLAPGEMRFSSGTDGLCELLLGGCPAKGSELDRHQRGHGRVKVALRGLVILEGVSELIRMGDEIGQGTSHENHLRYLARAGRMACAMASSPPHQVTTPTSIRTPVWSGPMNITMESD